MIIGPQGSGKSITTKLLYFFTDLPSIAAQFAERGTSFENFKKHVSRQFTLWFPPGAWGAGRFNINYYANNYTVRALRRTSGGQPSDEIALTFSPWFHEYYAYASDLFSKTRSDYEADIERSVHFSESLDRTWRARDLLARRIQRDLQGEHFSQQTFIPAGRAFFTSIGRLVAGFEQAGNLDPITIKFARLLAELRDRNARQTPSRMKRFGDEFVDRRSKFMSELFGGEITFEDDTEFVATSDGRRVPFSALSSGQQELLPMWSLLDYFGQRDAMRSVNVPLSRRSQELLYIEEPEAHLFPSAQSLLMEFLISSVSPARNRRSLVITTHSPYIMSKLNVFLKAGQLARRKRFNQEIDKIVPRECWIDRRDVTALAIHERTVRNIIDDEDDLIDGRYLDSISEANDQQFSALLRLEHGAKG